jgi:hypothetical protein
MRSPLFFVLWRGGLIALLGFAISQLHGWQPAPLLIVIMIGVAIDSIATLLSLMGASSQRSVLYRIVQTLRRL